MKKLAILIMVGVIFGAGITYVKAVGVPVEVINKQEAKQLDQYKDQVQREEKLSKLHNPLIIQNELKRVGKLTILEGQYQYATKIKVDKQIFGQDITIREMSLDLWWQFGLGMSLEYIKIKEISNDGTVVVLQIPKNQMRLQYIQLNSEKSSITDGKKIIFVNQFKPSDVQTVIEQSQKATVNKIGSNQKLFNEALDNLETQLEGLVKGLGYKDLIVEVI